MRSDRGERSDGEASGASEATGKQVRGERSDGKQHLTDQPTTVLAVDDQPANLQLLDAVLTPRGHSGNHHYLRGGSTLVARDGGRRPRPARHPDARDGRTRGLSQDPGHAGDRIPARRDDHGQRKRTATRRARIGSRRLRHQAVRPERAAGPGRVTGSDQAIPRHHPAAGRRARPGGTPNSRPGSPHRSTSWSAPADFAASCRHNWPIWWSATRTCLQSHRREIVVVFCDLRNFTPFAEASEPEELMDVLGEYHRAIGALIHEYEAPWSGSPVTGSWCSSTTRSSATTQPSVRSGCRSTSATPCASLPRNGSKRS